MVALSAFGVWHLRSRVVGMAGGDCLGLMELGLRRIGRQGMEPVLPPGALRHLFAVQGPGEFNKDCMHKIGDLRRWGDV